MASELHPIQSHLQIWMQDKSIFTWDALNCRLLDSLPIGSSQCIGGHTYATHYPFRNATPDPSDEHQNVAVTLYGRSRFSCSQTVTEQVTFLGGTRPPTIVPEVVTANDKRVTIHRTPSLLLQWIVTEQGNFSGRNSASRSGDCKRQTCDHSPNP